MGMWAEGPGPGMFFWKNIMQKWYDGSGKLQNIKIDIGEEFNIYAGYKIQIPWGEVTYEGNQVYVKDVAGNKRVLRVTLDGQGRPAASYFTYAATSPNYNFRDSIYYYYDNNGQLDFLFLASNTVQGRIIDISYDGHGNISRAGGMNFIYDHSTPVSGMLANFVLTGFPSDYHLKFMEFMGLLKLPMHHKLLEVRSDLSPVNTYLYWWQFANQVISSEGLVTSYKDVKARPYENNIFYTGWDCANASPAPTNRQKTVISSLEQFQQLYPQTAK
jgi:hypothetical protein